MRKPRSDSVLAKLPIPARVKLARWLLVENLSYEEVVRRCKAEFGVKTSETAVSGYLNSQGLVLSALLASPVATVTADGIEVTATRTGVNEFTLVVKIPDEKQPAHGEAASK